MQHFKIGIACDESIKMPMNINLKKVTDALVNI